MKVVEYRSSRFTDSKRLDERLSFSTRESIRQERRTLRRMLGNGRET
jgi:hypothetical protein